MPEDQKQKTERVLQVSNIPTAFSDVVNIAYRNDGCVLLQFISDTPTMAIENFRTIMIKENAIRVIDVLAKALDHYPSNPKVAPKNKKNTKI